MPVPIEVLRVHRPSLGLQVPWHFFWATGSLSMPPGVDVCATIIEPSLLVGISLGAVFMRSMTYIGDGPNFMVKAIAEQFGVSMPSFFGYTFKYNIPLLVPVFVIVTLIFLQDATELPAAVDDVSRAADSAISAEIEPPPVGEPAGH